MTDIYTIQEIVDMAKCRIDKSKKLVFVEQARKEFQGDLLRKDNHILGCMLECYANVLRYRRLDKEAEMLDKVASRIK